MRKIYLLLALIFTVQITLAQWQQTNGPYGGDISCISIKGSKIFAGTEWGGLFSSSDNGNNWVNIDINLIGITSIALNDNYIFVGTDWATGGNIYRSTDDGNTWTELNTNNFDEDVSTIKFFGNNVLAGTNGNGIFLSTDNGNSWTVTNNGLTNTNVHAIAIEGSNIFAGTSGGVFKSTDGGNNWDSINEGLTNTNIRDFAINGNNVYVGTGNGVFLSSDNDSIWTEVNNGLFDNNISHLFIKDTSIFAGTLDGYIFKSSVSNINWNLSNVGFTNAQLRSSVIIGDTILAGTYQGGVFFSSNNGDSWASANTGIINTYITGLYINDNNIFASTFSNTVSISSNKGDLWSTINNGLPTYWPVAYCIAGHDNKVFTGFAYDGVYQTTNNGLSWSEYSNGLGNTPYIDDMVVSDTNIYAINWFELYKGSTNINQWNNLSTNGLPLLTGGIVAAKGSDIFVGSWEGVYSSHDYGASWSHTGLSDTIVNSLYIKGDTIYAATTSGVCISTNKGNTWSVMNPRLYWDVLTLAFHGNNIFAGTLSGGIFMLKKNASQWADINEGLPMRKGNIEKLAIDDSFIYAATQDYGVWKRSLSETLAIPDRQKVKSAFVLYPNPAKTEIVIETQNYSQNSYLTIYNLNGQYIFEQQIRSNKTSININKFPNGIYFIKVVYNNSVSEVKKFVKE